MLYLILIIGLICMYLYVGYKTQNSFSRISDAKQRYRLINIFADINRAKIWSELIVDHCLAPYDYEQGYSHCAKRIDRYIYIHYGVHLNNKHSESNYIREALSSEIASICYIRATIEKRRSDENGQEIDLLL